MIGESGSADIPLQPMTSGGDVTICVTHPQRVPYIEVIPAAAMEGAYIAFNDVQCEQSLVSGAYVAPTVSLKNVGIETANNINVVLSTESEYIELLSTTTTIPAIAPDEVYQIANAFDFNTAVNIPNHTSVRFFLTCTSGDNVWESKFDLIFSAPEFAIANISNTDLTPGGNGTITFDITNNGGADAENCILEVYSSSNDLMLSSNTFEINTIESGATVNIPVELTVNSNVEIGSTYEISYLLTSGHYSVAGSYIVTVGNIVESFETGDFSMYEWTFGGSTNWVVVSNEAHSGTYSAQSGTISHSQQTDLVLTIDILADGEVSFYKKVSSENNWDYLRFYIDNVQKGEWSGDAAWSQETYPVTTGTHTFKWSYQKDGSASSGSDCAWIDDIQFPPTSVTLALDPVIDLAATENDHVVTLTWTAPEGASAYLIRRNGVEVGNQANTSFTDIVASDGIYTYSVLATNGNGNYSTPEFVTISVGTVGVEESDIENVSIYPNPANNILFVNGTTEFNYEMYNGMGQKVAHGQANGNAQINVSGMNKGVYFLRLTSGTQMRIEKVVVE